jgi:DNA-binding CsgD family transcriptional regulator
MSNPTNHSAIGSSLAPGLGVELLCRSLRELVASPTQDADGWAKSSAAAISRAIGPSLSEGKSPTAQLVLEIIDPGTGRCLSAASTGPEAPIGAYDPNRERVLIDAMGSQGGVRLRLWVPVDSCNGTPQFDADVRIMATCAVALFESRVWASQKRHEELLGKLTEAQQRVLELMLHDFSEREVGEKLARSQHTVHDHVKGIYAALSITSRAELLTLWFGVVAGPPVSPVRVVGTPSTRAESTLLQ